MGEYRDGKWHPTFGDVQAGIADEAPGEGRFNRSMNNYRPADDSDIDWISVRDKMPHVRKSGFSDYVLTYSGGSTVTTARIRDGEWRDTVERRIGRVTHWTTMINLPARE